MPNIRRKTPTSIGLVVTCPKCGEPVEIIITKKEIKQIYKAFKYPISKAQLITEKRLFEGKCRA